ncbi:MAG: DEAD/DEAH box helicase, partial [Armatimonadetes bacterium]|nr:DEAD/DEAH box helicase [Armatimonadota bacterium]
MPADGLELFHPLIAAWFRRRYGRPTDVQAAAWPVIAAGEHVLVTAPTGSGKTLTAFLWAINQLAVGAWERGQVRVLYVSPLKALNNDIRRNLRQPLWELNDAFGDAGEIFPEINVLTRSGDTAPAERQRMVRRPPEILITTPESLNLILSSTRSREMLRGVETVILDEIHAVAATKRGTHLITAVERLVPLAGEFQRLALSATVRPLELVAQFVGGYHVEGSPGEPRYRPRPLRVVRSAKPKQYECRVHSPGVTAIGPPVDTWWPALIEELKEVVRRNRSTLIFTNGRRMCEKLALLLNDGESPPLAYAHHGSLSRETRAVVEARLKAGELAAIVATGTLELGIDIGSLDEVALVETPFDVAAAIQRIGRAGHQVGETSRGLLFPLHGRDFLQAAVMCRCVANQDIEAVRPIAGALDVLAQVIVSMVVVEAWDIDHLYEFLQTCWPYHGLPRRQYDLVLAMLAGRYAESRIPALQPRLVLDPLDNLVRAREGARQLVQQSGGTIPDRGYYTMRHQDSRARIGELDEEFVWERRPGDRFTLGTQTWRIEQVTDSDVLVSPAASSAGAPFWRGEPSHRTNHFSNRIAELLEEMNDQLGPAATARLEQEFGLSPAAANQLESFLSRQRTVTGRELPHRHHLLIETIDPQELGAEASWVVLHTFWGGSLNRPFALALQTAWQERHGTAIQAFADNDTLVLSLPYEVRGEEILALVAPEEIDPLLRRGLESSGFFGARFRESAGRALLLSRGLPGRRMPLWLTRLRAKKLLETAARYEDFPILTETWRTCLDDEFELDLLRERLTELRAGEIRWSECHGREPSPLAESIVWGHTNELMYLDDTPAGGRSALRDDLLREAVFSAHLRP